MSVVVLQSMRARIEIGHCAASPGETIADLLLRMNLS
jgi:hypothetical protein